MGSGAVCVCLSSRRGPYPADSSEVAGVRPAAGRGRRSRRGKRAARLLGDCERPPRYRGGRWSRRGSSGAGRSAAERRARPTWARRAGGAVYTHRRAAAGGCGRPFHRSPGDRTGVRHHDQGHRVRCWWARTRTSCRGSRGGARTSCYRNRRNHPRAGRRRHCGGRLGCRGYLGSGVRRSSGARSSVPGQIDWNQRGIIAARRRSGPLAWAGPARSRS
jgi:hypothetical protein